MILNFSGGNTVNLKRTPEQANRNPGKPKDNSSLTPLEVELLAKHMRSPSNINGRDITLITNQTDDRRRVENNKMADDEKKKLRANFENYHASKDKNGTTPHSSNISELKTRFGSGTIDISASQGYSFLEGYDGRDHRISPTMQKKARDDSDGSWDRFMRKPEAEALRKRGQMDEWKRALDQQNEDKKYRKQQQAEVERVAELKDEMRLKKQMQEIRLETNRDHELQKYREERLLRHRKEIFANPAFHVLEEDSLLGKSLNLNELKNKENEGQQKQNPNPSDPNQGLRFNPIYELSPQLQAQVHIAPDYSSSNEYRYQTNNPNPPVASHYLNSYIENLKNEILDSQKAFLNQLKDGKMEKGRMNRFQSLAEKNFLNGNNNIFRASTQLDQFKKVESNTYRNTPLKDDVIPELPSDGKTSKVSQLRQADTDQFMSHNGSLDATPDHMRQPSVRLTQNASKEPYNPDEVFKKQLMMMDEDSPLRKTEESIKKTESVAVSVSVPIKTIITEEPQEISKPAAAEFKRQDSKANAFMTEVTEDRHKSNPSVVNHPIEHTNPPSKNVMKENKILEEEIKFDKKIEARIEKKEIKPEVRPVPIQQYIPKPDTPIYEREIAKAFTIFKNPEKTMVDTGNLDFLETLIEKEIQRASRPTYSYNRPYPELNATQPLKNTRSEATLKKPLYTSITKDEFEAKLVADKVLAKDPVARLDFMIDFLFKQNSHIIANQENPKYN